MKKYCLILCMLPSLLYAMDDDQIYSYTRAELASGETLHQSGATQSLALDGWVGGDKDRLWWQGDASWQAGKSSDSSVAAWYGHYIAPFWDAQIGLRVDGNLGSAHYLSAGVRGLAPYEYDTDLKLELRSDGKWFAHGKVEREILLTNRFILLPRIDVSVATANIDNTVRSGIYQVEAGLQARYEFSRKFAPFIELSRTFHPRALAGGEPHSTQLMAGLRCVF